MNDKEQKLIEEIENTKYDNPYYLNNPEMFDETIKQVFKNITSYGRRFKSRKLVHLNKWIRSQLKFLNNEQYNSNDYPINECVYLLFYGMTDFPNCLICGKLLNDPKKFVNLYQGFLLTCSKQCGELYREKTYVQTCIDRYGVSHYAKNKHRYKQRCDAMEEKYGVRNIFQLESTKKAIKNTKKCKYGNENYVNVELSRKTRYEKYNGKWEADDVKLKRKQSFMNHYGVDHNMKSKDGLKKYEDAIEKKYGKGIRNISQIESVKQKKIKTCRKNYGVDVPLQSKEVLSKFEETCFNTYGVPYPMQNNEIHQKAKSKYFYDKKWFASSPEIAFYIWLKDNGIQFEYQPIPGFVYEIEGKKHHYFPDFKVGELYFEIKGDQFFDKNGNFLDPYDKSESCILKSKAKWKCMIDHNVIIMRKNEYIMFMLYVKQTYGCNYLKQFKYKNQK